MTEDEAFEKLQNATDRMLKLIETKDKQIKYLLHYLSGIVLPVQMIAIANRLEKIANESDSKSN